MESNYDFFSNAPITFGLCSKSSCPSANDCLRGLAFRDLNDSREKVMSANPLMTDAGGAAVCSLYRPAEPVRVAYGFSNALDSVPKGNVRDVREAICQFVCQRNYYHLLRGEKPMLPDMQRTIAEILQHFGASAPIEFDRYKNQYDW